MKVKANDSFQDRRLDTILGLLSVEQYRALQRGEAVTVDDDIAHQLVDLEGIAFRVLEDNHDDEA